MRQTFYMNEDDKAGVCAKYLLPLDQDTAFVLDLSKNVSVIMANLDVAETVCHALEIAIKDHYLSRQPSGPRTQADIDKEVGDDEWLQKYCDDALPGIAL